MQGISFLYIFDMEWTKEVPYPFGQQLKAFIPPLIIIGFNQLLLLLIQYASRIKFFKKIINLRLLIIERFFFLMKKRPTRETFSALSFRIKRSEQKLLLHAF